MKGKWVSPTTFARFYLGAMVLYNLVMLSSIALFTMAGLRALIGHKRAVSALLRRAHDQGAAS